MKPKIILVKNFDHAIIALLAILLLATIYAAFIAKEKKVEAEITRILRKKFSFRFIMLDSQVKRMGTEGLESSLIGTFASCKLCRPSSSWLGNYSPKHQIKESGLWLVQHLNSDAINENDRKTILNSITKTKEWIRRK